MKFYTNFYRHAVVLLLLFTSCSLNAKDRKPYVIYGEMVMEDSIDYELAGLSLYLLNKTEKPIESFTVVFYLFDENGNIPMGIRNNIVLDVNCDVDSLASVETVLCIDKFMSFVPEEPYQVDYLYLSKILYTDGTTWTDPLGFNSF